jgi:tRNA-2-methylthio-N6-dimethylallyladenosine synthase
VEKLLEEKRQGEVLETKIVVKNDKKLYIESFGCAMNFSDSEIVASILSKNGYNTTKTIEEAS